MNKCPNVTLDIHVIFFFCMCYFAAWQNWKLMSILKKKSKWPACVFVAFDSIITNAGKEVRSSSCPALLSHFLSVSPVEKFEVKREKVYLSHVKLKLNWILLSVSIKRLDSTLILCQRNQLRPACMMGKWASERWPVHPPSSQITLMPCSSSPRPAVCTNNSRHVYPLAHRVAHTGLTEQHTWSDLFTAQNRTCTPFTKIHKAAQCLDPFQ